MSGIVSGLTQFGETIVGTANTAVQTVNTTVDTAKNTVDIANQSAIAANKTAKAVGDISAATGQAITKITEETGNLTTGALSAGTEATKTVENTFGVASQALKTVKMTTESSTNLTTNTVDATATTVKDASQILSTSLNGIGTIVGSVFGIIGGVAKMLERTMNKPGIDPTIKLTITSLNESIVKKQKEIDTMLKSRKNTEQKFKQSNCKVVKGWFSTNYDCGEDILEKFRVYTTAVETAISNLETEIAGITTDIGLLSVSTNEDLKGKVNEIVQKFTSATKTYSDSIIAANNALNAPKQNQTQSIPETDANQTQTQPVPETDVNQTQTQTSGGRTKKSKRTKSGKKKRTNRRFGKKQSSLRRR